MNVQEMMEMFEKEQKKLACLASQEYILEICDNVAVPVLESKGNSIYLYSAKDFASCMTVENPYFYVMPKELYLRESRKINALFTRQCLGAPSRIIPVRTIARFDDMPKHRNTLAGGFEILLTVESGGIHVGDNPFDCDVIHPIYKRVECKFKAGRIISQAKVTGEEK